MDQLDSFDTNRLALVGGIADAMYTRLVKKVIADIKALPDNCRQSGDDSSLKDVWEEFKYQVQREESGMFAMYEDVIRDICDRQITGLDREQRQLLWLWSEGYSNAWVDKDEVSIEDLEDEPAAKELYDRVCSVAESEELAIDPDDEGGKERYEESGDAAADAEMPA
jgi:hypothetical protein